MKYVFTFLFVSITYISFGQLKTKNAGWYQGEMKAFTLYQNIKNVNDQADFIKIEASSICLFLHENNFQLYVSDRTIQGTFEVQTSTKKEQRLFLKSLDFGTFQFILNTKKKFLILTDKEQQPPVIMKKLKRKKACN